jgi:O-methyltransferase / aklanonic acid methyltransferase
MKNDEEKKERIAALYHRVSALYGNTGPNYFAYAGQRMVEHIGIPEGATVLDAAAGRGANLFAAALKAGPQGRVIGIDLAEGMVRETGAEIKRRGLHNATIRQMDAEHLTFPDASFDYILCNFAIFLFPHLEQALSEFFRVLRPGGKLGITVAQSLDSITIWYRQHITEYAARYHFPIYAGSGKGSNYAELPHYLEEAAFSAVQVRKEQIDFDYTNVQEWWDARWTHGPRYALEHMTPEILAQFKTEVLAYLQQEEEQGNGIRETLLLQYFLAAKTVE